MLSGGRSWAEQGAVGRQAGCLGVELHQVGLGHAEPQNQSQASGGLETPPS